MDKILNNKKRKERDIDISKTLRSEFHFLKFPFFNLCTRSSKRNDIEVLEEEDTEEGKIEIWWRVSRNVNFDFPSSFARKLHKEVVEKALNNIKKPVPRFIRLGSMRQICQTMNIAVSGKSVKEIKKALQDIKSATIQAKGTFRKKEKNGTKKFFEGNFNLYDMVFFTGETLPDGTDADAVYIQLNDMYVQNFNNNFVVPLDYPYLQSLKGDITSRMYEVFSVWFYPALENGKKYIQKQYSEICSYFPLTRQDCKWKAKGQLKSAHQQHIATGFLASEPEWIDTYEKNDWLLRYYIGPRAKDWHRQNKKLGTVESPGEKIEDLKVIKIEQLTLQYEEKPPLPPAEDQPRPKDDPLLEQLLLLKIPTNKAKILLQTYSKELIEGWIMALDIVKPQPRNKAGYLLKALEEKWELPAEVKERKEAEERERGEKLQADYDEYILAQVYEYLKTMDPEQVEKEIEAHGEVFYRKYPHYEEFKGFPSIKPYIKHDYKRTKAIDLNLPTFEDWKKDYHKAGVPNK